MSLLKGEMQATYFTSNRRTMVSSDVRPPSLVLRQSYLPLHSTNVKGFRVFKGNRTSVGVLRAFPQKMCIVS